MGSKKSVATDWPAEESYSLVKLRDLIAAMTMPEKNMLKRHIRSHSADNHESKYIQLFDCVNDCLMEIERQKKKNISTKEQTETTDRFYAKFIARHRLRKLGRYIELGPMANYLYDRILDALRYQNTDDNQRLELYARMLDIQLLLRKGLKKEGLSMIRYAKELAINLEAAAQVLELTQMECRLLFLSAQKQPVEQLRQIYKVERQQLNRLETIIHLKNLLCELSLVMLDDSNVEQSLELRAKLNYFIQYVNDNPPRETFEEEFNFQTIMFYLIRIEQRKPSAFLGQFLTAHNLGSMVDHLKAIATLYEHYPERKKEDPKRYHDNMFNYLGVALAYKTEVRMEDYAAELEKIPPSDPNFLAHVVYLRLVDYVVQKDFLAAKKFLETNNVWQLIERSNSKVPTSRLQVIHYLAGMVYFVRGEYKESIEWFTANLQYSTHQASNAEARGASALYSALARFERGFATPTAYRALLPPLQEHFKHQKNDDSFEYHLLQTLEQVVRAGKNAELLKAIAEKALPIMQEKAAGKLDASHYGLFLAWLESKQRQRPLRNVLDKYI